MKVQRFATFDKTFNKFNLIPNFFDILHSWYVFLKLIKKFDLLSQKHFPDNWKWSMKKGKEKAQRNWKENEIDFPVAEISFSYYRVGFSMKCL